MPHPLFTPGNPQDMSREKAYLLSLLLRGMEYADADFVEFWRLQSGCGKAFYSIDAAGWPLPYTVLYHPDGVIVAMLGLRNLGQALGLLENSALVDYYVTTGKVYNFTRILHAAHAADIVAKVQAAPNKSRVILCGHSAGGSLASILYSQLKTLLPSGTTFEGYTFGSPMPGDRTFAANAPTSWYTVQNVGDPVPWVPFFDKIGVPFISYVTSSGTPRAWPIPISLRDDGSFRVGYDMFSDPALPRLIMQIMADPTPTNASAVIHGIGSYNERLRKLLPKDGTALSQAFDIILEAVRDEVGIADYPTPKSARTTAAVATPPAPTVATIQEVPSTNGNPASPPPPPPNTDLVGITHRVYADTSVTTSKRPPVQRFWHGDDRRMIERMQYSLQRLLRRDTLLNRLPRSPELSTLAPFFGPDELVIRDQAVLLENYLGALLNQEIVILD